MLNLPNTNKRVVLLAILSLFAFMPLVACKYDVEAVESMQGVRC